MDNHLDDMVMIEPSIAELVSHLFTNWNQILNFRATI